MPQVALPAGSPLAPRLARAALFATPARAVLAVIVAGTLLRLAMAVALGYGVDEGYMVVAGRDWRFGYFDHPPLSWWLSHGMAALAGSEAAWVVRLPFIALFAVSTWLVFRLGAALFGPRAGAWAAAALNLSPVFAVTSGGWVLPDGPLDCALAATALCLVHAVRAEGGAWRWWLGAGLAAGGALLSKYSAALVLAGAFAFLLSTAAGRAWLRRPQPYMAAALALAVFAPVPLWNAAHGWASFAFQGGRAGAERFDPFGPLRVLGGGALFVLPGLWLPMMLAFLRALRRGPREAAGWLCACLAAGPVFGFALVGLWSRHVLYHWAAPGYLMLFPLLGAEIDRLHRRHPAAVRRTALATAALLVAALAVVGSQMRWNWLPLPQRRDDPALQAIGWDGLREALAERGLIGLPRTAAAAANWQEAGKLGLALGPEFPLLCLHQDARQFRFTANASLPDGWDALLVTPRAMTRELLQANGFDFARLDELAPVSLPMPARPALLLRVYRARSYRR